MPVLRRNVRRNDDSDLLAAEEIDDRLLHLASLVAVVQQDVTASLEHREPILEVAGASIIGVVSIDEEHIEGPHIGRALALRVAHDELHVSAHSLGTKDLAQAGVILGRDADGKMPESLEAQCANMFGHMKATIEAAGGTTDDIIKMTVWLKDRSQRGPLNAEWLKMFPDERSRPARHSQQSEMEGGTLVQCDFTAVID